MVQFAHGRLVIHRDLKPSNILVQADGAPRLLDFGIAKLLDPDAEEGLRLATRPDTRLLTPEHAAPEQLRGEPVSTATDVYALGILLYSVLAGRRPFPTKGRPLSDLELSILEDDPPPPSALIADPTTRRSVRQDLDRIALMAIRKEPERRYSSAGQFAEELDRFLAGEPVLAIRDTLGYRARKFVTRNRGWVTLGTGIGVALLLALASAVYQGRQTARERDRAERERTAAEATLGMLTDLFRRSNPRVVPGGDTMLVSAFLDDAERRAAALSSHPDRLARLNRVLGNVRAARGQYPEAETLLRSAFQWYRTQGESRAADAGRTYFDLAKTVYWRTGATAEPVLDTALTLLQHSVGNADSVLAQAYRNLAFVTVDLRRRQELLDSAVAVQRRMPGLDSLGIADQLDSEASQLFARGRYREAAALYAAALRIVERRLPVGHPDRLTVMGNLAVALINTSELEAADTLAREVLRLSLQTAPNADGTASAYSRVANVDAARGRNHEAEVEFRAGLDILRRTVDPNHDLITSEMRNLGIAIARQGRVEQGLALVDSAYRRALVKHGPSGRQTAYLNGQRGYLLQWLGRTEEADTAIRNAATVLEASEQNPVALSGPEYWMGILELGRGNPAEAVSRMSSALEMLAPEIGPGNSGRAQVDCGLGTALARAGRTEEALPHLKQACPIFDQHSFEQPLLHRWSVDARRRLGI